MGSPRASVVAALPDLFGKWEGQRLNFMYTDRKGKVTTGTGNLIDPVSMALALEWSNPDGSIASPATVELEWNAVKNAWPKVQSVAGVNLSSVRLGAKALDKLMTDTMQGFWNSLEKIYPKAGEWPADAQMMLLSRTWSSGPGAWQTYGSGGATFKEKLNADPPDFVGGMAAMKAASAHEEKINPGIVPRDLAEVQMAKNAADVLAGGLDPDTLWVRTDAKGKLVDHPVEVTFAEKAKTAVTGAAKAVPWGVVGGVGLALGLAGLALYALLKVR
jgi:GH24 family phage-related lysozyme (muramidase)